MLEQLGGDLLGPILLALMFTVASIAPKIVSGTPLAQLHATATGANLKGEGAVGQALGVFDQGAELLNGRAAMMGLVALAVVSMVGSSLTVVVMTLGLLLWERFAVPWAAVRSSLLAVDLVHEAEEDSSEQALVNCFTKSYGKYAKGTGSLLARSAADVARLFAAVELAAAETGCGVGGLAEPGALARLTAWPPGAPPLRYLTPLEVARLHGFPASFSFPEHVTRAQQWQLLGNSLSTDVVACLLTHLLADLED